MNIIIIYNIYMYCIFFKMTFFNSLTRGNSATFLPEIEIKTTIASELLNSIPTGTYILYPMQRLPQSNRCTELTRNEKIYFSSLKTLMRYIGPDGVVQRFRCVNL